MFLFNSQYLVDREQRIRSRYDMDMETFPSEDSLCSWQTPHILVDIDREWQMPFESYSDSMPDISTRDYLMGPETPIGTAIEKHPSPLWSQHDHTYFEKEKDEATSDCPGPTIDRTKSWIMRSLVKPNPGPQNDSNNASNGSSNGHSTVASSRSYHKGSKSDQRIHLNTKERERRNTHQHLFEELKKEIPSLQYMKQQSKQTILNEAIVFCKDLKYNDELINELEKNREALLLKAKILEQKLSRQIEKKSGTE